MTDRLIAGRSKRWFRDHIALVTWEELDALVNAAFPAEDAHSRGIREGLERAAEELATRASIARWAAAASTKGSVRESELLAVYKELQAAERVIRGQIGADESALRAEASKLEGR